MSTFHRGGGLLLLAWSTLAASLAQTGDRSTLDRSAPPESWKIPDAPVRPAEESIRHFDLPDGFSLEIVASEPLVQDPISVTFDERGRAWVLEWPGYNWPARANLPGMAAMEAPKSRVVILEDTDRDGRMDRRTVFLDGIEWARGVQPSRDGAFVLALPRLLFARDTDGDGKADASATIVDGLPVAANPWIAQADIVRTLDNWLNGSRFTRRIRAASGPWQLAPQVSRRGQWGLSQDNFGRLFYSSNGDHLIADLVPGHYFTRNPHFPASSWIDVRLTTDQRTWPHAITPGVNRRGQLTEDGRLREFTANTGPVVYRGDQFGPEYAGNVFLGEAAGRFVRRSVLRETDSGITAANAYAEREFIFSHDERFRPVAAANGPDGTLYLVDLHRGILEGYLFHTSFLRGQFLARKLYEPFNGLGRIYRVVRTDRPRGRAPEVPLDRPAAWVSLLSHPNGFWRDTAQRLLVERSDLSVVAPLRDMALHHANELARIHALWTLEGLGAVTADLAAPATEDASPRVREAALRIAEPLLGDARVAGAVLARTGDPSAAVRRQLLFTLGEFQSRDALGGFSRVLLRDGDQPGIVEIAMSGLAARELALVSHLIADPSWSAEHAGGRRLLGALAQSIGRANRPRELSRLFAEIGAATGPKWMRTALLDGLASAMLPRDSAARALPLLVPLERAPDAEIRQRAAGLRQIWSAAPAEKPTNATRPTNAALARGEQHFALCAACHGPAGQGQPGIAPALAGSKVVAESDEAVVRSILFGRNLERKNTPFPDMPPFYGLPDDEIAAIASFVRARWGGATKPVRPDFVRTLRQSKAGAP